MEIIGKTKLDIMCLILISLKVFSFGLLVLVWIILSINLIFKIPKSYSKNIFGLRFSNPLKLLDKFFYLF
jgi:hypothetical protein